MSGHIRKIERWERMQELTEHAAGAVHAALLPIAQALGSPLYEVYGIRRWRPGYVTIQHVDHRSGGPYDEELHIPIDVWSADDPVTAAKGYAEKKKVEKVERERKQKLAEIDRLTRELAATKEQP